jgi:hypothetical protein
MPRPSNGAHVARFAAKGKGARVATGSWLSIQDKLSLAAIQLFKSGDHGGVGQEIFTIVLPAKRSLLAPN